MVLFSVSRRRVTWMLEENVCGNQQQQDTGRQLTSIRDGMTSPRLRNVIWFELMTYVSVVELLVRSI